VHRNNFYCNAPKKLLSNNSGSPEPEVK